MKTFLEFINENFQFEHDIEKEFNDLNKLLFNGEVILPPYAVSVNKHVSAWVSSIQTKKGRTVIDESDVKLNFSKNCILTPEQFRNTLAHEMIHLLLSQRRVFSDYGGDHGIFFTNEMDRINNMSVGIKISSTNDQITPFQQRKGLKREKDFYVLFFNFDQKNEYVLCPFSVKEECENFWDTAIKSFKSFPPKKPLTLYMGKTNIYELNHYSIARTARNVKQFIIPKDLFDKLVNETEIYNEMHYD